MEQVFSRYMSDVNCWEVYKKQSNGMVQVLYRTKEQPFQVKQKEN